MQRTSIDILLLVEHLDREMDISCAISHLARRKHQLRTEIVPFMFRRDETFQTWEPRVVAIPYSFPGERLRALREVIEAFPDARFVDLSYEQIYHNLNRDCRKPSSLFAQHHVLHHAWGSFHTRYLCENDVSRRHVTENGNPVYALYREPYSRYYDSREALAQRHGLDASKPWVLIPENYKAAFLPEDKLRLYVVMGSKRREIVRYRKFDIESFAAVLGWWYRLAEQGNCEIIVRPRPVTPAEDFEGSCLEKVGKLPPSFHITKEGTVREWILASDVVMSSISTSLIEAAVAGKHVYALMPYPLPEFLEMEWSGLIVPVATEEAFREAIERATNGNPDTALMDWATDKMLQVGDPINGIVDLLAGVHSGDVFCPPPPGAELTANALDLREENRAPKPSLIKRLFSRPGDNANEATSIGKKRYFEKDNFSPELVADRLSRWAAVLD